MFQTKAIGFYTIRFFLGFLPVVNTGLNLAMVIYKLPSQWSHTCVNIWRWCSVNQIILAGICYELF